MNESEIELNITLTVADVNAILASLGKHPFEDIFALITKIREQGEAQLAEKKSQEEAETAKEGELV